MKIHEEKREKVTCPFCNKTFFSIPNLKQHIVDFHPDENEYDLSALKFKEINEKTESDFMCVVCRKAFARMENLAYHMKAYHFNRRLEFQCRKCNIFFASQSNLMKHIRMFHQNGSLNDVGDNETGEEVRKRERKRVQHKNCQPLA